MEEQYGGDGSLPPASTPGFKNLLGPCLARFSSAYMLLVGAAQGTTRALVCPESLSKNLGFKTVLSACLNAAVAHAILHAAP